MKILVCTKNITYSCGASFLKKGRIVARNSETRYIFRNNGAVEQGNDDEVPIRSIDFANYFRDANENEQKAFYERIKSIELITENK